MNILLIHQYFLEENEHGGSRWNEISKVWTEKGHSVTVISGMVHANGSEKRPQYKGKYFVKNNHGAVSVWRTHVSESYNKNFIGRLWGYFSFMVSSFWAGTFYTKDKFDFIVVTSPPLFVGLTGVLISKIKRIPLLFEIRDLWPESAIDTGILKNKLIINLALLVENIIYKNADLINVLTPAFREKLIQKKRVKPKKIIYIPNAADFTLSESIALNFNKDTFRESLGWQEKFVVLYVGAHGVANALDQLLNAAKLLEDTNLLMVLVGEGMEKPKLKERAKEMTLNNVVFLDPVPKKEVFKYILSCDVGTSVLQRNDTFKTVYSNKTFDYMSCKKPILMAIDGVSRKLVEDAKAGVYVEPENAADFNKKIRYFMLNPDDLTTQGQNGYNYAKENFDRNILAERYIRELVHYKTMYTK
jgi:glycosyltransferase involved in cell wall biosynthesis